MMTEPLTSLSAPLVLVDSKVTKAFKAHKEHKESKGYKVFRVRLGLRVYLGKLTSNKILTPTVSQIGLKSLEKQTLTTH